MFHSAPTMRLGIVHNFELDYTLWVRDVNVTFFGCYSSCSACTTDNDSVACTSCNPSFFLTGSSCNACDATCNTCSVIATNCTSCSGGDVLKSTGCSVSCGVSEYPDADGVCHACPSSCSGCSSFTVCTACGNSHYLSGTSCIACDSNCDRCAGLATTCTACDQGVSSTTKYLQSSTCVSACNVNGYFTNGYICTPCSTGCLKCNSSGCLKTCGGGTVSCCNSGSNYWEQGNGCSLNGCSNGYWLDLTPTPDKCEPCNSKC